MKNSRFYLAVTAGIAVIFLFAGLGICAEVVVDDRDAGFTGAYGWNDCPYRKTSSVGGDSLWNGSWYQPLSSCIYRPTLPESGEYEVYVWWPDKYGVALDVPYIIHYSGGSEKIYVDQGRGFSPVSWRLIGKWSFDKGSTGYVEVQNRTSSAGSVSIFADAIKFVYVGIPNNPPTASVSADKTAGYAPLIVQFYGSGSDSDGSITGYSWDFGDGGSSDEQNPIHTYTDNGEYTATLTVTDDKDAESAPSSLSITAINQPPTAIIKSIDPNPAKVGETVRFEGGGQDEDGSINAYSWRSGIDGILSTDPSFEKNNLSIGPHVIYLKVRDDDNEWSSEAEQILTILPLNEPPVATASASPTSGPAPLTVQFYGEGSDSDGTVISYYWEFGDGSTSPQQNPIHEYENIGTYIVTLTVTDDKGATGTDSAPPICVIPTAGVSKHIPHLIRFQGRLTDKNKNPLDGSYDITFRIYDAETEGSLLWQETHENVQVEKGIVDLLLGSIDSIDLKFDKDYYLSAEISSDGEMTPRQRITSVGYTYRAEFASKGGTGDYTTQGEISDVIANRLSIHLDSVPGNVKLYIWGEAASEGGYPDGLTVEIDGVDQTLVLLALANLNWAGSETQFGDGTDTHPLVAGANGVTGTGGLDITTLASWTADEHTIEIKHSAYTQAKVRYNVYVTY